MKNKILVLGSNGLVGSSLVRRFTNDNKYEVIESTRKSTNLFNFEETKVLIEKVKPDLIINAAAKVGGIQANNTLGTEFILENLKININLLEACIPFNEIKIINLGSSCIYPLEAKNPIKETSFMDGKLEPTNSPYAMAKLTAIEMGKSLKKDHGHQILNLMPTNLYGPNDSFSEDHSHVIPGIIRRIHKSKINNESEFQLWGTGKPLREFLYVDDLAEAIQFIIENDINDDLLNVGSGEEISIYELSLLIKEIVNYEGKIIFDQTKPDGNPRKLLDSSKLNSYGWSAKTSLRDGLKTTYRWYLDNIDNIKV
ncbi:MAG: GDP-fucose synthetase [Candidatus Marinimicrobia bacterium]|nr:GDP-fucose synthetase [Candidatus Neomarinimicrobiota bacterium]